MGNEVYNKDPRHYRHRRVGTIVADRALGLRMNVVAYDPFISPTQREKDGISLVTLDELLKKSNFIYRLNILPALKNEKG